MKLLENVALVPNQLNSGALGVDWWHTAMSIAKRNIGKSTRMIAGAGKRGLLREEVEAYLPGEVWKQESFY